MHFLTISFSLNIIIHGHDCTSYIDFKHIYILYVENKKLQNIGPWMNY